MALSRDISIYCSIYRSLGLRNKDDNHRKNFDQQILTIFPLLKIYNHRSDHQCGARDRIKSVSLQYDELFYQGMVRGYDIGFENMWILIKHYAERYNSIDCLLSNNIDINMANQNPKSWNCCGETALILASCEGHVEIVDILIGARCALDKQDNNGNTALIAASDYHISFDKLDELEYLVSRCTKIVDRLIIAKSSLDILNKYGSTALIMALHKGNNEIARTLISARCSVGIKNMYGVTAFDVACNNGSMEMVETILDAQRYT